MPFTLTMPKLSPTMEGGTIVKWRKKEGDAVKVGDVLFEVSTDKATVEHSAIDDGFLRKILIREGEEAIVNQPIAIFTEDVSEDISSYKPEGVSPAPPTPPAPLAFKEENIPAAVQPIGAALGMPAFVPQPPLEHYVFPSPTGTPASPLARKLAVQKGIDLTTVKGSGPGERIVSRDLDLGQPDSLVTFGRREQPAIAPGTYEEEPLSPIRKVIAQRLQEAKTFIPHFYASQDIDASALMAAREQLKNLGLKVSFNDFIVRACSLALREHPHVNSGFNSVNKTLIRFKTIDISVAVSVDGGLITPIVRHADYKNLGQLAVEIKHLVKLAREGKLAREQYMGGSFTISNLGMFGITDFVGIINPPQAALLAVGGIGDKPIVKEGTVVPGKVMRLTLSADHRVVDGADAAKFLKTVQQLLENPSSLLL